VRLTPGSRLRSQVCSTELIAVRAPGSDVDLRCGGEPMVDLKAEIPAGRKPAAGLDTGNQIGKRYTTDQVDGLEMLVTKPGLGTLAIGAQPLVLQEAKPLPSTD
jgi:hypothetical protein